MEKNVASQPKRRGRRPTKGLTLSQKRTLKAILEFQDRQGYPPSIKELGDYLNITAAGAHDQVDQLVRKGFISREPRKARSLIVLKTPDVETPISIEAAHVNRADLVPIPLVNRVDPKIDLFCKDNILGEILIESRIASKNKCFALEMNGDELKGAEIHPGDILIIRQQPIAESGDIVIACLNGRVHIHRLYIRDAAIELRAENSEYATVPVKHDAELKIIGKMVGVKRFPMEND
jgi:repressor LexA